jgi:hypothetical protein
MRCHPNSLGRSDGGSVMVISLISMIPIFALVMFSLMRGDSEARAEEIRDEARRASANALSGLELAKAEIVASEYGAGGAAMGRNDVIWNALQNIEAANLRWDPDGGLVMAFDKTTGQRIWVAAGSVADLDDDIAAYRRLRNFGLANDEQVTVWITPLDGLWHMLESESTVRRVRRTARVFVRERDPFTRYNLFVDDVTQPVSVDMTGNVHSNRGLKFYYGDLSMGGYMAAVSGFSWIHGADWSNIEFQDGFDEKASAVELPSLANIQDRLRPAVSDLAKAEIREDFIYVGSDYASCDVDLQGDQVEVRATRVSSGTEVLIYSGSIEDIRRIYVAPKLNMRGDLRGRLSVASESPDGITVDGDIRYVDEDGDPAWGGGGGSGGSEIASVEDYQPNPSYDGNSSLGILAAAGDVTYLTPNDSDLELHAAIFSQGQISIPGVKIAGPWAPSPYNDPAKYSQGRLYDYDSSVKPRYLLTVGMTVSARHKIRGIVGSDGVRRAGFENGKYCYDAQLQNNPPPYFIDIERPMFRGRHLLEGRDGQ